MVALAGSFKAPTATNVFDTPAFETPGGVTRGAVPVKRLPPDGTATVPSGPVPKRRIGAWTIPCIPEPSVAPPEPTDTPTVAVRGVVIFFALVPTCYSTFSLGPATSVSWPGMILFGVGRVVDTGPETVGVPRYDSRWSMDSYGGSSYGSTST